MNAATYSTVSDPQEEWLKVLGKGMVTLPKRWRDELGFTEGSMIRAIKQNYSVVIEPINTIAPYRVYTDDEIDQFLQDDQIPTALANNVDSKLTKLSKSK